MIVGSAVDRSRGGVHVDEGGQAGGCWDDPEDHDRGRAGRSRTRGPMTERDDSGMFGGADHEV